MYHVSAQGVDERMINVHYYYYNTVPFFPTLEFYRICTRYSWHIDNYTQRQTS